MNQLLLERSTGSLTPDRFARFYTNELLHAIQNHPRLRFDGGEAPVLAGPSDPEADAVEATKIWAHAAGVNALSVDTFENRILLSGGADSTIQLWNLDHVTAGSGVQTIRPTGQVSKSQSRGHKFGITALSFFPFDSEAFLSSSYDHTLKLYATESLQVSVSFDVEAIIYSHAMSTIASHMLVACATQHPVVRLVDLRSGSTTHSLPGHSGGVLSVSWSPAQEHVLASGGTDGTVRLWDVRKSASSLFVFDKEDSIGRSDIMKPAPFSHRETAKAHDAAVNGLTWTHDGSYLITAGHDEAVRVWDAASGANTLASFGPTLKNSHISRLPLLVSLKGTTPISKELLFYPNENEILAFELHQGRLLKRLRTPGPSTATVRSRTGERSARNRITSMIWRGISEGFLTGHVDGQIRAWVPRTQEDELVEAEDLEALQGNEDDGAVRKRKLLDDVYRDLTEKKITFG